MDDCLTEVAVPDEIERDPARKKTAAPIYLEVPKAEYVPTPHTANVAPGKPPEAVQFDAVRTKPHRVMRQIESPKENPK